jgi:hypothetical protein
MNELNETRSELTDNRESNELDKVVILNELQDKNLQFNDEIETFNEVQVLDNVYEFVNQNAKEIDVANRFRREIKPDMNFNEVRDNDYLIRSQRQTDNATTPKADTPDTIMVDGVRVEEATKEPKIIEDGIPSVLADSAVTLR